MFLCAREPSLALNLQAHLPQLPSPAYIFTPPRPIPPRPGPAPAPPRPAPSRPRPAPPRHAHLAARLAAPPLLAGVRLADVGQQAAVRLGDVGLQRLKPAPPRQALQDHAHLPGGRRAWVGR